MKNKNSIKVQSFQNSNTRLTSGLNSPKQNEHRVIEMEKPGRNNPISKTVSALILQRQHMDGNATKEDEAPNGLNDLLSQVLNSNDYTNQGQISLKSNAYLQKQIHLKSPNHSRDDFSTVSKGGIWRLSHQMKKKKSARSRPTLPSIKKEF